MHQKVNYQKLLDKIIDNLDGRVPKLLVHSCCAPCSSYVLEYLSNYFDITVLYYNPNIYPYEEYEFRKKEQKRLISEKKWVNKVEFMDCDYENDRFNISVKGHEKDKEGGDRCEICFELRLEKTVQIAKEYGFEYFVTTLSISPLKNAELLNNIGEKLGNKYGVSYLLSDFKKRGGYQRSVELSKEYSLYRQNYCGFLLFIKCFFDVVTMSVLLFVIVVAFRP